ncbi:MAG: asparagine--tRNA ligase [Bacteroidia bacterium]|nr:asparagine--tRNA ligase [Bacteroidia bacterium]
MKQLRIAELLRSGEVDQTVMVSGWVRTARDSKNVAFVHINDGSCQSSVQAVVDYNRIPKESLSEVLTGACVTVTGKLTRSQGSGQTLEIQTEKIEVLGTVPENFPLQKKGHTLEFLREIAHLRPRTNTFGAVLRIRHHLAFAIHKFFDERGFFYLHAPIITGSDAEGAGEMFRVTTLDMEKLPKNKDGSTDYSKDFFGKSTNLTVSGQLEGELAALALGLVYTFGPTFRAENSNTPRHLAEFWMIEPEMAFYDITDNMNLAEDLLKYVIRYALEKCKEDLEFLNKMYDKELLARLMHVAKSDFQRLSYTEGIEVLKSCGKSFEYKPEWGADLQKEHETYLVEHFGKPVIITDYPKTIKAFYMKQNEDGKTVRAMDILFPFVGEMVGGSQREENYEKLKTRITEMKIHEESLWWYLETRKFGTCVHSGFGLGFERLVLFVTGLQNVRDIIPFPRTPGNAEF